MPVEDKFLLSYSVLGLDPAHDIVTAVIVSTESVHLVLFVLTNFQYLSFELADLSV